MANLLAAGETIAPPRTLARRPEAKRALETSRNYGITVPFLEPERTMDGDAEGKSALHEGPNDADKGPTNGTVEDRKRPRKPSGNQGMYVNDRIRLSCNACGIALLGPLPTLPHHQRISLRNHRCHLFFITAIHLNGNLPQ